MVAAASELLLVATCCRDLTVFINSFISAHEGVSVGATDSSNRRSVSRTKSLSTDVSLSLVVPKSNGSTTDTIELSTSWKYTNTHPSEQSAICNAQQCMYTQAEKDNLPGYF